MHKCGLLPAIRQDWDTEGVGVQYPALEVMAAKIKWKTGEQHSKVPESICLGAFGA